MKKLSIALAMVFAASAAVAADKVETVKNAPVKMSAAEMSKVVAGAVSLLETNQMTNYRDKTVAVGFQFTARPIVEVDSKAVYSATFSCTACP